MSLFRPFSNKVNVLAILLLPAVLLATGCGGLADSPSAVNTPPATPAPAPPPPAPPPTPKDITAINHVVFMLQENRSFDSYFGQLGVYRAANGYGAATDIDGLPATASNNAEGNIPIPAYHFRTQCIENLDPDWLESHGDFNFAVPSSNTFVGDGYVHNAQGQAKFDGMVAEVSNSIGTVQVKPTETTNYYLFSTTRATASVYSSLPLAVVTVTVTGDKVAAVPANVQPQAGVAFGATVVPTTPPPPTPPPPPNTPPSVGTPAVTITPGQIVTLTWSVPGALKTMVNTRFDQMGRRAMGFYDGNDLPYYYFMASNFATSDRWFSPLPSNSPPNRAYIYAATTHGHAHDPGTMDSNVVKNIFQLLDDANITWKVYYTIDPNLPNVPHTFMNHFQPWASQHQANLVPVDQYFADLKNNSLPQVAFIEELPGFDEHPGATLPASIHSGNGAQGGAQYAAKFINALMSSSSWKDSVFFLTFDEAGGFYDHVAGQPAVSPDGLPPSDLRANDIQFIQPPADFTRTGFRVPLLVISPFVKKSYVSHTVADFTAILKFIETRFNLPNLTARDKAQIDMQEFFDFTNAVWATPPTPPDQPVTLPCDYSLLP